MTRLWTFPQRIYALGKVQVASLLGRGLSVRLIGYALLTAGPVVGVLALLNVPWEGVGITVRVVLPGVLVWLALRYAADGGAPLAFARDVTQLAGRMAGGVWDRARGVAPGQGRPVRVVPAARRGTRVVYGVQQPRQVGAAAAVWAVGVVLGGGVAAGRVRAPGAPVVAEDDGRKAEA